MQVEIIGYKEARSIKRVGDELIPSKTIRRYLALQFPDGTIEMVRVSRAAIDKYIGAH